MVKRPTFAGSRTIITGFEREKWLKEVELRERELSLKEREAAVREGELAIKVKEARRNVFFGPLGLAVVGAIIAGGASVAVSYHNAYAQRILEQTQAEHARIDHAINNDTAAAPDKLKFLLDMHLIAEEPTRTDIAAYIDQKAQKPQPAVVPPPPSTAPVASINLDSAWVGGGHNQSEMCGALLAQAEAGFPGKDVKLAKTDESSRKDFLGHVTYQYHCQFSVF